jgi:hypothetical protein
VQDLSETGFAHSSLELDEKVNPRGDSPLDLSAPVSGILPGFAPEISSSEAGNSARDSGVETEYEGNSQDLLLTYPSPTPILIDIEPDKGASSSCS